MAMRAAMIGGTLAGLVVVSACGTDSSGPGVGGASLALQIEGPRASDAAAEPSFPPFGDPLVVDSARIIVDAGNDHCCTKFNPGDRAFRDRREIVLTGFDEGPVSVDVRAFASSVVPAAANTNRVCTVSQPLGVGKPCDTVAACPQVSLSPETAATATLVKGKETVVRLPLTPRPFVVRAVPECDVEAAGNPAPLELVVAEFVREPDPANSPRCTCENTVLRCDGADAAVSVEVLQPQARNGACSAASATATAPVDIVIIPTPTATPTPFIVSTPVVPTPQIVLSPSPPVCCRDEPGCAARSSCCKHEPTPEEYAGSDYVLTGVKIDGTVSRVREGCVEARVTTMNFPSDGVVSHPFRVPAAPPVR